MALYETVFVARQDLSTAQVETLTSALTDIIKKNKGSVGKTEYCGLRPLAYPIKKNRKGHYVLLSMGGDKKVLEEVDHFLRLNEDLLRHTTVSVEKHDEEPSSLYQQSRSFRESSNWDVKLPHAARS
ncbi:MAG: 30S ribosomal protein S6 [bacterium]|nr:30S ribosomal protein S6 [bacterium]